MAVNEFINVVMSRSESGPKTAEAVAIYSVIVLVYLRSRDYVLNGLEKAMDRPITTMGRSVVDLVFVSAMYLWLANPLAK